MSTQLRRLNSLCNCWTFDSSINEGTGRQIQFPHEKYETIENFNGSACCYERLIQLYAAEILAKNNVS